MKKNLLKTILSYVLVAFIAAGTTAICFLVGIQNSKGKLDEVQSLLSQCFIGDMDMAKLEDAAAYAMVDALDDEWSYYMTSEEYKVLQENMNNAYVGVGITVQVREDEQGIDIIDVFEGGPAMEAGLQPGDRLTAVNGISTIGKSLDEATKPITGEEGTTVELTVARGEESLTFTVERRHVETPVATYQMLDGNIGLITIENFQTRCASETIAAVDALMDQGAKALVFDVRNNPGGYKHELVELLDYLLPEGEIFRTVDYNGREEVDYSDASCVDIPMAVLVNLESYSAAEFFAAALDYYDAAVIVGEKTYGKGYFQSTFRLKDGSAVNLSIGKYFTPDGKSLAGVGLTPDLAVPLDEETEQKIYLGTLDPAEDPQIQAAITALKQ